MRIFIGFILFLIVVSGCVPNRKLVYLQKDDVNNQNLPKDIVVRSYSINQFDYRVQSEDIISVRFESLTPKDLDFLNHVQNAQDNVANVAGGALLVGELVDQNGEIPVLFLEIGRAHV